MSSLHKILLSISTVTLVVFAITKSLVLFSILHSSYITRGIEIACFLIFLPLFYFLMKSRNTNITSTLLKKIKDTEEFIDAATIISIADKTGKITYVNKKFEDVSGWTLDEVIGKDHNIVNSGLQPDGYWGKMYETVMKGKIWHDIVTNRTKTGELYYFPMRQSHLAH